MQRPSVSVEDTEDLAATLVIMITAYCARVDRGDVNVSHGTEELQALNRGHKTTSTRIAGVGQSDDPNIIKHVIRALSLFTLLHFWRSYPSLVNSSLICRRLGRVVPT